MAKRRPGISVHKLNNAKPKDKKIPWYNPEDEDEKREWDETPEEDRDYLTVTYSRAKFTPQLERAMNEKLKGGLPGGMLSTMLMKVLLGWDVVHYNLDDDDNSPLILTPRDDHPEDEELVFQVGEAIPLTERTLDQMVCIPSQARIVNEITEDNRPNAKKSAASNNTF